MNVYINRRTGGYSGGLAVAAARSGAEAHGVLLQSCPYLSDYYEPCTWELLPGVNADTDKPKLLAEAGYTA